MAMSMYERESRKKSKSSQVHVHFIEMACLSYYFECTHHVVNTPNRNHFLYVENFQSQFSPYLLCLLLDYAGKIITDVPYFGIIRVWTYLPTTFHSLPIKVCLRAL